MKLKIVRKWPKASYVIGVFYAQMQNKKMST